MTFLRKLKAPNSSSTVLLSWVALFLGEARDGLTMINMQSAYLLIAKNYTEKQVGALFFVFGMSQFLFQAPAGYFMDYTHRKTLLLGCVAVATTLCTLVTALYATDNGGNLHLMMAIKVLQGAITAFVPIGLNSITQGIVGCVGMTAQVSTNEMMNHLGTSFIVVAASVVAFCRYPDTGVMFVVSPIACVGVLMFLMRIRPEHIDHDAARGLTSKSETPDFIPSNVSDLLIIESQTEQQPPPSASPPDPSFIFGFGPQQTQTKSSTTGTLTPMEVLADPILMTFTSICFLFHVANAAVLPLVMQTLAIGNGREGILMSGLCIVVSQLTMVLAAGTCGRYSAVYGRKFLFLVGLFTLSVRCAIILVLLFFRATYPSRLIEGAILSTQILDGVGAGVFGTMYILVTSDIARGSGRFSMALGVTSAAMSIGGTVSGYLGEYLAQDFGYENAFATLGLISTVPALMYLVFMPETLPGYGISQNNKKLGGGAAMESIVECTDTEDDCCTESDKVYTQIS